MYVCTCVYLFKFRTVFVPFTGYPSCGFQNCFSPHLLLSQGLLFSVSSCPYLICALPSLLWVSCLPLLSISPRTLVFTSPLPYRLFGTSPRSPLCFLSFPCLSLPHSPVTPESLLMPLHLLPTVPSLPSCPSVLASQNIPSLHRFLCFPMALTPSCLPSLSLCDLRREQI